MDTKAVLSVFLLLAVCNTYGIEEIPPITVRMAVFTGETFYIHKGGFDNLECIVKDGDAAKYARVKWFYNSQEVTPATVRNNENGTPESKFIKVESTKAGKYTCRLNANDGSLEAEKAVDVIVQGNNDLDVFLTMETKASQVIKDDTPALTFVCRTGGGARELVMSPDTSVFINHKPDGGQEVNLYTNSNPNGDAVKTYGLELLNFGGYTEENIYLRFKINKPHPNLIGTLSCTRGSAYIKSLIFTDSEDLQSMSFTLLNSLNKAVVTKEIQPGDSHKKTQDIKVRPGTYIVKCSAVGGHPPANVELELNGVVQQGGDLARGKQITLGASDKMLSCKAGVPKHHQREIVFKLAVEIEPRPTKCMDVDPSPGDTNYKFTCYIGTAEKTAHCKDVFFEVKNEETDVVTRYTTGKKDDNARAYCFNEKEGEDYKIRFYIELLGKKNMEKTDIILYHQIEEQTQRLGGKKLGALGDINASAGLASMSVVSLLCLALTAVLL